MTGRRPGRGRCEPPQRQPGQDGADRGRQVEIAVPRDRDGSFAPQIVKHRQRRLSGVEDMVISPSAKGLTTGEIQAH
jgi:transposase-like protein